MQTAHYQPQHNTIIMRGSRGALHWKPTMPSREAPDLSDSQYEFFSLDSRQAMMMIAPNSLVLIVAGKKFLLNTRSRLAVCPQLSCPHRCREKSPYLTLTVGHEEEDDVKNLQLARGRGGKEAREDEKQVQTNRQELTVGLGKGRIKGRKSTIFNQNVFRIYE